MEITKDYVQVGQTVQLNITALLGSGDDVVWMIKVDGSEEEICAGKGKMSFPFTFDKKYENKQVKITAYVKDEPTEYWELFQNTTMYSHKVYYFYVLPPVLNFTIRRVQNNSGFTGKYYCGDTVKISVVEYDSYANDKVPSNVKQSIQWYVMLSNGALEALLVNEQMFAGEQIQFNVPSSWCGKIVRIMPCIIRPDTENPDRCVLLDVKGFPMVIDLYKMPGLNNDCTDIANDMTFGFGNKYSTGRPIYNSQDVAEYKARYVLHGVDSQSDTVFTNASDYKFIEGDGEEIKAINDSRKAIYSRHDLICIESENKAYEEMQYDILRSDDILFGALNNMAINTFSRNNESMAGNIGRMISFFKRNRGGIYEDSVLNSYVTNHPSTNRYCRYVETYIKDSLKRNQGGLRNLEDIELYVKRTTPEEAKNYRQKTKAGKETFLTPIFSGKSWFLFGGEEENRNIREGITIAVNDVWAARIDLTSYSIQSNGSYYLTYRVILWDHFGLEREDLFGKWTKYSLQGFRAWLILQHHRGYKPFVTKMTVLKTIHGNINE